MVKSERWAKAEVELTRWKKVVAEYIERRMGKLMRDIYELTRKRLQIVW
jgi:hypothetical protein